MQELLYWMRRLVYPAAIALLLWAGYLIVGSPYISESDGKILAVYDGDSTVPDCKEAEHMTPDKENPSEEALAGFCGAVRALSKPGHEVDLLNIHEEVNDPLDPKAAKIYRQLASRVADGSANGLNFSPFAVPVHGTAARCGDAFPFFAMPFPSFRMAHAVKKRGWPER